MAPGCFACDLKLGARSEQDDERDLAEAFTLPDIPNAFTRDEWSCNAIRYQTYGQAFYGVKNEQNQGKVPNKSIDQLCKELRDQKQKVVVL